MIARFVVVAGALLSMAGAARAQELSPFAPTPPTLTRADVEKLVVAIPELAKESNALNLGGSAVAGPDGQPMPSPEDMKRVETLLGKYGFTLPDFFMKMTVLVSVYLALKPEEFERQLPREDSPEVQRLLKDPKVSDADKAAIKAEIAGVQGKKEMMRAQLMTFATEENKATVKPMLAKVQQALEIAEKESQRARTKLLESATSPKAGPRRAPPPPGPKP